MKKTFKAAAAVLAVLFALASLPLGAFAVVAAPERTVADSAVIDTDGSDGYSGDYVVIYNPDTSASSSKTTGNMSGLIQTQVGTSALAATPDQEQLDRPYRLDVDGELAEQAKSRGITVEKVEAGEGTRDSFNVGDTKNFIILNYSPAGMNMEFKVVAKGEHCYIWTPTSTDPNVHPLDSIDPDYAQMAADEFDSKFPLMQSSFGEHTNGMQGDGRLSILYYNIDDGWTLGQGYIGGYFTPLDLYLNGLPILNIDTYPGVHYVNADGEEIKRISDSYGTMVHEYQHLINFSELNINSDTWMNECWSAAAEEICYPGSSVISRIQSWTNYFYRENDDWLTPPAEFPYVSSYSLHNGFSMYDWNNDLEMSDLLVLYAQVSLFAQYIFTQHGNGTYRQINQYLKNGSSFDQAFQSAVGQSLSEFTGNFRAALSANTAANVLDGVYSFSPQQGYDPENYHGVLNPYDLLGPVVFTGSQCAVKGGGAICVKPVGGVYNPPSGAASGLVYFGITRSTVPPAPAALEGIALEPASISLGVGESASLSAIPSPLNAADFHLYFSSSDTSVATVAASGANAVVTGVSAGTAIITVTAHDNISGNDFTAQAVVTVSGGYLPGDVDMNGTVNVADAIIALRAALGLIELSDIQLAIADMDANGGINVSDALTIMRIALGLE